MARQRQPRRSIDEEPDRSAPPRDTVVRVQPRAVERPGYRNGPVIEPAQGGDADTPEPGKSPRRKRR